jgi:hypothetical protein
MRLHDVTSLKSLLQILRLPYIAAVMKWRWIASTEGTKKENMETISDIMQSHLRALLTGISIQIGAIVDN